LFCCSGTNGCHDEALVGRHSNELRSADKPSSVDVYYGFCALHNVMTYIVDSQSVGNCGVNSDIASDDQVLPSQLASAGQHISSILMLDFRLEIMEDMFSLLFSRTEHLRDSEDSPECQSDSEPETHDDTKHPGSEFDASPLSEHYEDISDVFNAATHEVLPVENRRVGALAAESRCSPMEASSSSRSDELSGSQTVSNSSVQCGNESGFLARDYVIHDVLTLLHNCCEELSNELDTQTAGTQLMALRQRVEGLREHITDAQWRLRIAVPDVAGSSEQLQQNKRHHDIVTCKDTDAYFATSGHGHAENAVVLKMLCRPESLLNLCLAEGRVADAEEVSKVCYLHIAR